MKALFQGVWKPNAAPMAWSEDNRIHYNTRTPEGLWQPRSAQADGSDVQFWAAGTGHVGISDVTPDGRYALLVVERPKHWPYPVGTPLAEPGKGTFNDIWLTDGIEMWQLTGSTRNPETQDSGTCLIWPRFNRDATKVIWAQGYHLPTTREIFGYFVLKVASIAVDGSRRLFGVTTPTLEPNRFYEPYGWTNDGRLLFASDMSRQGWWDTQIWTCAEDGTQVEMVSPLTKITIPYVMTNYCEFSQGMSDGSIIFARGIGSVAGGLDYWRRGPLGTFEQLSDQSKHQLNHVAGGFALSPDESHMVAGYAYDAKASMIDADLFTLVG